ncbi:Endonuclease/Exonuclease/phosphatase family protein [Tritrichomonas foetus]|uniref:Endonuclease/Exonuclease/phosphatase family protein n=1 Tax=Tritrichomonas foetus TaxID=1144522 RepID=A0A1J4L3Q5_9EUKA|nr:Endonuclease/Exonuclease/phosphatase family protein [Tritrichomonas foetus]|eukprot:OHT16582.1 Endonuclease/Exonuclease/phosphatase family protein [Tritrichomonas foetus]
MQAALQESKIWIKRDALLSHNNKPVQIRIHIFNYSIINSFLSIEDAPNSFCFIPISPEIGVSFTYDTNYVLYLQFTKYENIILSLTFNTSRDLEVLVSHLCKSGLLLGKTVNQDKFRQQNINFLKKIKSPDPIKPPITPVNSGSSTALSPIILDPEAQTYWETNIFQENTQFYIKGDPIKISFLTWNVASGEPDSTVIPYLNRIFSVPASSTDIVIIALEEIDMSMKSVVTGNTRASNNWKEYIEKVNIKNSYKMINCESLGGVFCAALVKNNMADLLSNNTITTKKLGANGMLANKAAVILKFTIGKLTGQLEKFNTSICVITCHLAPHEQNLEQRNSQWHEIVSDLEPFDYVVCMGDLNYRISLNYEACVDLINKKNISELLSKDQLLVVRTTDNVIGKFIEPEIKFYPTFKFDPHCDRYDTSQKHRVPSWTDRILIKTAESTSRIGLEDLLYFETDVVHHFMKETGLLETDCFTLIRPDVYNYPVEPSCICYRSLKSSFSDHRPVHGAFKFIIPVVDNQRKQDLSEIIVAKYDELKKLSIPKLDYVRNEENKILLVNKSLVWAQWRISKKPSNVEITPSKGLLTAAEKIALEIKCISGEIGENDSFEVFVDLGDMLCVKIKE